MFLGGHGVLDRGVVDSCGDLPQEHRPTLSICHHPSARFTRVITLMLRPLHRIGCPGALSDARFREPSAAPCRAVNHALAAQDARLEGAATNLGRRDSLDQGCNCAAPKDTLKRSHHRITLLSASVSASLGTA